MISRLGDAAGFYAGGTELLLAMRHGALRYEHLVDVKVLSGFDRIELRGETIVIGASATHRAIEYSPVVREHLPVLSQMESRVANVRVRASGTIGGNLCFAEPHSDPATLLLALDAICSTSGPSGVRQLAIADLINGPYSNSLAPGELLTTITVPVMNNRQRAAYVKFQVHERPMLGLALLLDLSDDLRSVIAARVAIGCLCPFPRRSAAAEELLKGSLYDVRSALTSAASVLADEAELIDDHDGGTDYKRHLLSVFLRRAFEQALT